MAHYEQFEKKHSIAVVAKKVANEAHERFKNAVAELSEQDVPDHELQEIRRKLEDSTREMVRREEVHQEMRGKLVRLWKVNADLLTEAISWLDKTKGQKQ